MQWSASASGFGRGVFMVFYNNKWLHTDGKLPNHGKFKPVQQDAKV
jgi:hypothetical protein